jgi:phosphoglucosamine mutase
LALDRHSTGDGIVSALQIFQSVIRSGRSLADQLEPVRLFPQSLINVSILPGFDWRRHGPLLDLQQMIERELGSSGRILIRASGTEPVLRVMVEANDPRLAASCASRLADAVRSPGSAASTSGAGLGR